MTANDLARALEERFGHVAFRPGQEAVVRAVLEGRDVVAVMPTGGGKSLCFQLPALLLDGVTLVVSPLIALMKDQVDALRDLGHDATFVNSSLEPAEQEARLRACRRGEHRLLYVAPERLASPRFLEALAEMRVVRLAVDEAHCISQWGHDFRPDYLRLGELRRLVGAPPTAAFTATATPQVRQDVEKVLDLRDPAVFVAGFERPNLRLVVERPGSAAEKRDLLDAALDAAGTPAIVYASTRKNVEAVAAHLRDRDLDAVAYHAGLPQSERERVQDAFMRGSARVIVATNAFGMGVDKSDVRLVVHHDVPGSVEQYYQEAGRAGRDGKPATCVLLYSAADVHVQRFFLEGANPDPAVVRHVLDRVLNGPCDLSSLAAGAPTRNSMAVETAVGLLRRSGAIVRVVDPASGDERFVPGDVPATGELPVDEAALAAKRRSDEDRLRSICAYATSAVCRRAYVLRYFGSDEARDDCGACDRCVPTGRPAARTLSDEERTVVRIALSGVARANDRFGRSRLAHFLAGSRTREVVDAGLDQFPTHGKLSHLPLRAIGDLLESLADQGLLVRRNLDGPGSGAVLSLSAEGRRVMVEDPPLHLALPPLAPAPKGKRRATAPRRPPAALVPREEGGAGDDAADPDLAARLRTWRLRVAKTTHVPPYVIFPDTTLDALAAARPGDEAALSRVPGIGPARLERWGGEILKVLRGDGDAAAPEARA